MAAISRTAFFLLIVCAAATCIVEALKCIDDKGAKKCNDAGDCPSGQACLNLYRGKSGKKHSGVCAAPQDKECDCDPNVDNATTCANGFLCKQDDCPRRGFCSYTCTEPSTPDEIAVYLVCTAASQWYQVYRHDGAGNVVSGSLDALVASVERGAEVKVLTSRGLLSVQSAIVGEDDGQKTVNAQIVFWMIDQYKVRYYISQSTTGTYQYSCYFPGFSYTGKTCALQNKNEPGAATWFVREAGVQVSGPAASVAVGQGATLRGVWGNTTRPLSAVSAGTAGLSGQFLWHMPNGIDGTGFPVDETFEFSSVDSAEITTASLLVQDENVIDVVTSPNDATWFADTCWTEVYSHNENGQLLSGNFITLLMDAMNGKPVMVKIDGTLYETGLLRVSCDGSGISAQVYDRMNGDISTPTWRWLEVCTDGTMTEVTNRYGADGASVITPGATAITWFTKNENWQNMFTTDGTLNAAAYQAVLDEGVDVRYMIERNGQMEFRQADVVRNDNVLFNERELLIDGNQVFQKRNFLYTDGSFREMVYVAEGGLDVARDGTTTVTASVYRN